jgi:glutamate-1-semialdehyde 2,1-aminomutase
MATEIDKRLEREFEEAERRFTEQNPASKALHEDATNALPGGNTRTVLHTSPFPLYIESAKGYQVVSEDNQMSEPPHHAINRLTR